MKAISWEVFQSVFSGTAYGQFRLAFGASCVVIHTIHTQNLSKPHKFVEEYLAKIDRVLEALNGFSPVLGTKNFASYREWLNPIESGATGSVAYHHDVDSDEALIYFELASCDHKVRIYPHQFPRPQLANMRKCLDSIQDMLIQHRKAVVKLDTAINAETVKTPETLKEVTCHVHD